MNKVLALLGVLLVVVGGFYILSKSKAEAPVELPGPGTNVSTSTAPTSPSPSNPSTPTNPPVSTGKCYVGGCSSQICSDQPDMASTCEWREEYACYKTAKCERQPSGQCGWTPTVELNMCLNNAGQNDPDVY